MKIYVTGLLILFTTISGAPGPRGEKHDKQDSAKVAIAQVQGHVDHDTLPEETGHEHGDVVNSQQSDAGDVTASLDEFPNLHPLIVHFPIVLLLLAAICQIVSFFIFKKELSWVTLALLTGGFAGAYAAGILTHPHTAELTAVAQKVLDKHDFYAYLTIWSSGIGLVIKATSHFLFKRKVWAELIVLVPLLIAAYGVSMAGHHGSQLVYIEGVGPQGKFLETEGHGH